METTDIRVDDPIVLGGLTLIPVVEMSRHCWQLDSVTSVCGVKTPIAVIIVSPTCKSAYRTSGEDVSIDELIEEVPVLTEILESL